MKFIKRRTLLLASALTFTHTSRLFMPLLRAR